jgi:hypothetical protein
MNLDSPIEIWGGLECTINRVKDSYHDQFEFGGHYNREDDIELISSLGVTMLRYPVIWDYRLGIYRQKAIAPKGIKYRAHSGACTPWLGAIAR